MTKLQILLLILASGAIFRFYGLKKRGVLYWDDGLRLCYLQYLEDLILFVRKNFSSMKEKKVFLKEAEPKFRGRYLDDTNPLHIPLYYLTYRLTGNIELSGPVTNAAFGLSGIVGVFLLGEAMFNPVVGLLSAFVLAFSAYHIVYCRR